MSVAMYLFDDRLEIDLRPDTRARFAWPSTHLKHLVDHRWVIVNSFPVVFYITLRVYLFLRSRGFLVKPESSENTKPTETGTYVILRWYRR